MEEYSKYSSARYQQVATDIAAKIVNREYQIGEKIYARSSLASQYAVSAETARRAIAILADLGIVEATKGSGVVIRSYEKAQAFLQQFRGLQTVAGCRREVIKQMDQFLKEADAVRESVSRLVDCTNVYKHVNPFTPFELAVEEGAGCLGLSLSQLNFWHNTGATVLAIRRGDTLTVSPGPYADLAAHDIVYFIGEESCVGRVARLLDQPPPAPPAPQSL